MRIVFALTVLCAVVLGCHKDPIRDRPISFSAWRREQMLDYVRNHYRIEQDSLEMLPVMVVAHYTAMDSLDVSFEYMNREEMETGRSLLRKAGNANIAVHFLVDKDGSIFRLMPENQIGRHTIGLNRHAVGIENVGLDANSLTMAQVEANAYIVRRLAKKFPIRYLIGHSEYRRFENTPLWDEIDPGYRTEKYDPGEWFMAALRARLADLNLAAEYNRSEIPDRLYYTVAKAAERGGFSGVALVIDNGNVVLRSAWGKNPENGKPLSPEDRFYFASAAKPVTALAVGCLVAAGKIAYNTPVAQYFPELGHLLRGVQVRHLLSHSSGLVDYYSAGLPEPGFTNADAMKRIAEQKKPLFAPGSRFHYANSNYLLLAELVVKISGKTFEDFVRQEILQPVGMQKAIFLTEPPLPVVAAWEQNGGIYRYPYRTVGPGGLAGSADDLAALDLAVMDGRLLSAQDVATMLRPQQRTQKQFGFYGLGWYIDPNRGIFGHDGRFHCYRSVNWLYPKKRQAIVLLANRCTELDPLVQKLDRVLNGLEAVQTKKSLP